MKNIFLLICLTITMLLSCPLCIVADPGKGISGLDLSVKGGYFRYAEPDADITYAGIVSGVQGNFRKDFSAVTLQLRTELMAGNLDYNGQLNVHQTASASVDTSSVETTDIDYGSKLWYSDSSLLIGKAFDKSRFSFTASSGIGYRLLSNPENPDVASDYSRKVTYIYLPLVLEIQKEASGNRIWGMTGEVDILLQGSAQADLSDASDKYNDLTFTQSVGGAVKLAGFYHCRLWKMDLSVTPFVDVWFVDNSDTDELHYEGERVSVRSADGTYGDYREPANVTFTGGLQLAVNF